MSEPAAEQTQVEDQQKAVEPTPETKQENSNPEETQNTETSKQEGEQAEQKQEGEQKQEQEVTEQATGGEDTGKASKKPKSVRRSKSERVTVDPKVVHAGYLTRKTDIIGRWVKHWISLESEGELLRWFKAEPQEEGPRKPQGSIALAQVADIRDRTDLVPTNWPPTSEPGNSFIVGTPAKAYFFVAENEEQKSGWIEKLTGAKEKFGKEGLQPKYAAKLIPKPEPSAAKETEQGEGEAKTEQGEGGAKTEQGEGEAKTEQGEGEAKTEQGEGGVAVADVSPKQTESTEKEEPPKEEPPPNTCLLYTSPSPRDRQKSRMPSSA